ncbi:MAG: hypothetical protein JNK54_00835 [Elusimicrobia bacterium]|jgi:hypothetical protein|nr:hypothetical protein [Elusimicrobiota bacterium]
MKYLGLLILLAVVPAHAVWYGAVGKASPRDGHALEFIYDTGSRDLKEDNVNSEQKLSAHRFTAQYARGLGQGFEFLLRGVPMTSRINFAGSSLNPDVWGVGGGLHWAPLEPLGPVRLGLLATVDYYDGRKSNQDKFNWLELGLAAGATYALPLDFNATGGVSMLKADVNRETNGTKKDYSLSKEVGGFVGAGWAPNDAWNVSTEYHFGNERVWGLSARYNFE